MSSLRMRSWSAAALVAIGVALALGGPADAAGLVAHYKFDVAENPQRDSSGNGNTGLVLGATWTAAGQIDGALEFDGANDTVNCGNPASLLIQGDMTMAAWVKPDDISSYRGLISKWSSSWIWILNGGRNCFYAGCHPRRNVCLKSSTNR